MFVEAFLADVLPLLLVCYPLVALYCTRWMLHGCSRRRITWPVAIGLALGFVSVYFAYASGHRGPWSAHYGIQLVSGPFRLYAGAIAEALRLLVGFAIVVRVLGFTFRTQLRSTRRRWLGGAIGWLDLFIAIVFFAVLNHHLNPSFGPTQVLREAANDARSPGTRGERETGTPPMYGPLLYGETADSRNLLDSLGVANSNDEARNAYIRLGQVDFDSQMMDELTVREQALVAAIHDRQQALATTRRPAEYSSDLCLATLKGALFDSLFFRRCQVPYAIYCIYSTLGFCTLFVPLLYIPAIAIGREWAALQAKVEQFADRDSSERMATAYGEYWESSIRFFARYAELPLLIAAFLGVELAFASKTLSNVALKLSIIAALSVLLLGAVAFAAAISVQAARDAVTRSLPEATSQNWFVDCDLKAFFNEIRYNTVVGVAAGFAGTSVIVGIVVEALRRVAS